MPVNEHGPFNDERAALSTRAAARIRAAFDARPGVGASVPEALRVMTEACEECGVELGRMDLSTLKDIAWRETFETVSVAGMIRRAFEAGKAAGPDGAVTAWGFRYESDGSPAVFMPYPLEDVQQMSLEFPPGTETTRTIVARRVGPWTEAELPAFVACRYCLGPIIPCEPRHDHPACKGWKHAARLSMGPIGPHYCEGRSVNPSGEPAATQQEES